MYEEFASVYDSFMEDVPYDAWSRWLIELLRAEGIEDGLICELGCGTGSMTERLARAGYDMIGVDISGEMLGIAQRRELLRKHPELREEESAGKEEREPEGISAADPRSAGGKELSEKVDVHEMPDILYLQQDMRSFELYGTVRAIVSVCDSLNYLTEEEELLQVFRLVNNYLDPGGLFLFDMNTPFCYGEIGEQTIAENRPEGSFIWENSYDPETQCNRCDLTLFLPVTETATGMPLRTAAGNDAKAESPSAFSPGNSEAYYIKKEECHIQRGYTAETVCRLLREAGMKVLSVTEAYTGRPVEDETERLLFVAREAGK